MKDCKKILLIAKPRSGSTVFLDVLRSFFQVKNVYNEPGVPQEYEVFESLLTKGELMIKIIVSEEKGETNRIIQKVDWDKIIMLRRNDNDSMLSMAHQFLPDTIISTIFEDPRSTWSTNYKQQKDVVIPKFMPPVYKELELRIEEILGMNDNIIELTYENLYNQDRRVRIQELNKIIDTNSIHWLILKNVVDRLDPRFKYTKIWNKPEGKPLI